LQVASTDVELPVPAADVFDVPEKARAPVQPFPVTMHHYAEGELPPSTTAAAAEPRMRHGRGGRVVARQHARATRVAHAATAGKHQAARPAATPAKRTVHVASLKKRRT